MRVVTFAVEVEPGKSKWLWDSHITKTFLNGVKVVSIAEGDAVRELAERDEAEIDAMESENDI